MCCPILYKEVGVYSCRQLQMWHRRDSLGTNLPSMTSTWTHCAPASTTDVTCSSQIDHAQHSKGVLLAEAFSRLPSFR